MKLGDLAILVGELLSEDDPYEVAIRYLATKGLPPEKAVEIIEKEMWKRRERG